MLSIIKSYYLIALRIKSSLEFNSIYFRYLKYFLYRKLNLFTRIHFIIKRYDKLINHL